MMSSARACAVALLCAASVLTTGCGLFESEEDVLARLETNLRNGDHRAALIDLRNLLRQQPGSARLRVQFGEALLATGDVTAALAELRKARELGAPDAQVAPPLAEALAVSGDYTAALAELDRPGAAAAGDARASRIRGSALLGAGRLAESVVAFRAAVQSSPADVRARLGLASALHELEGADASRGELEQALEVAPRDPQVRIALAVWHMRAQDVTSARTHLEAALQAAKAARNPAHELATLFTWADLDLTVQDLESAQAHLRRIEELAPKAEPTLLLKARIAIARNEIDAAEVALGEVLGMNPDSEPGRLLMGAVKHAAGNLAQAESYLAAAVAENPDDIVARRLLAEVQLKRNKPEAVLQAVASPGAEQDDVLLSMGGQASILLGDLPSAIGYFERSKQAAPDEISRTLQLAAAYLAAKRGTDALPLLTGVSVGEDLVHKHELLLLAALEQTKGAAAVSAEARRFVAARPSDPEARYVAARGLLAVRDTAAAKELVKQAIELYPGESRPWTALGLVAWSEKDAETADKALTEALRINPADVTALTGRAEIALARHDASAAVRYLEQACGVSESAPLRRRLAWIHLSRGDLQRATESLARARKLAAEHPDTRLLEGMLALARGQDAVATFTRLSEEFPRAAPVRLQLARALLASGKWTDSQRAAAETLRLDPSHWPALAVQVTAAIAAGDEPTALESLESLRRSAAPRSVVSTLAGDLAMRRKEFAQARREYATAFASVPSSQGVLKLFAARTADGSRDATGVLREWLQTKPDDVRVRLALAQQLQSEGRAAQADAEYTIALQHAPTHVVALNNLAWLRLQTGDTDSALELAQRAYAADSRMPQVADTYGWILVKANRAAEALPILRAAHGAAPQDGEIRFHFAAALAQTGAKSEAQRHLESLVSSGVAFPAAAEARSLLESLSGGRG